MLVSFVNTGTLLYRRLIKCLMPQNVNENRNALFFSFVHIIGSFGLLSISHVDCVNEVFRGERERESELVVFSMRCINALCAKFFMNLSQQHHTLLSFDILLYVPVCVYFSRDRARFTLVNETFCRIVEQNLLLAYH